MPVNQMPRGLEALFGKGASVPRAAENATIPVQQLEPNPYQPRHTAPEKDIEELAESIRSEGVIQPIVATERGGRFYIIAGERRWRAAQKAGLSEVPVIMRAADERQMLVCALVENVQRRDLSPIEESSAYDQLRKEFSFSAEGIAELVGKSRSHISNMLRLLDLPTSVQNLIHEGQISAGHGKVLLSLNDAAAAESLAARILRTGMTVRQLEFWITEGAGPDQSPIKRSRKGSDSVKALAAEMTERLGRRVWISVKGRGKKQRGRISVEFTSPEDFKQVQEALLKHLPAAATK